MKAIKGITLIEMLTAIAVGGVMLSLISTLFIEFARTWRREEKGFSAWQSGDRFVRDFRRDLRRSLPGGAGYDGEVFVIEFTGEFFEKEIDPFEPGLYTARYYMSGEGEKPGAVREIFINGEPAAERIYAGVESFSCFESGRYRSLFNLEVQTAAGDTPLRASIHSPAEGAER